MLRKLFNSYSFFFVLCFCFNTAIATNDTCLTGVVIKRPWSKSVQSWCAGGSDYYTIKYDHKYSILSFENNDLQKSVANLENRTVTICGKHIKFYKTYKPSPLQQCPVDANGDCLALCHYFHVIDLVS